MPLHRTSAAVSFAALLSVAAAGCIERNGTYRSPQFKDLAAPSPVAILEIVDCNAPEKSWRGNVFAPVREALDDALKQKLEDPRIAIGDKAGVKLCNALTGMFSGEWGFIEPQWWDVEPDVAKVVAEVGERTHAKSVVIPIVLGSHWCDYKKQEVRGANGQPAYTVVDKDEVICHESPFAFIGTFVFSADKTMLWKSMQSTAPDRVEADATKMAGELAGLVHPDAAHPTAQR